MYRKSTRQRVVLLALLAATATVVTIDFRTNPGGPIRRVQDVAISIVAPIQEGIERVFDPVGEFLSSLGELPGLRSENARLRARIEALEEQQRQIPEIVRENERLVELLQEQDWKKGRTTGARVISGAASNLEESRLINKGTADGLQEGMAVVSAEGLVGRVVFTAPRYSKILLIIDPRHSVGARLVSSSDTGVVTGRSDEDMRFELIEPETAVADGETVVTSGYDRGIYPPGVPIGRVTRVQTARDGLSKTAFVRPFVNFGRLDVVLVLIDSGPVEGGE